MNQIRRVFDQLLCRFLRACGVPDDQVPIPIVSDPAMPQRILPSHGATHVSASGYVMRNGWLLPLAFPSTTDASWRETVEREVTTAHEGAAICDSSFCCRICIVGVDAERFLTATFATPIDAAKVGQILHLTVAVDGGGVNDRITIIRLETDRFLLLSDTDWEGRILTYLDDFQTHAMSRPDVAVVDLTESHAQVTLVGPNRRILAEALSLPTSPELREIEFDGMALTIVSGAFLGIAADHILLSSGDADLLMMALIKSLPDAGAAQIGLEALDVLALESGVLTGEEIYLEPPFEPVGLLAVGPVKQISQEAVIHAESAEISRGFISRAKFSPTLQRFVAVACIPDGSLYLGTRVWAIDQRNEIKTLCEITTLEGRE